MQTAAEEKPQRLPETISREDWESYHWRIRGALRRRIVRAIGEGNPGAIDEALSEALALCFERICVKACPTGAAIGKSASDALRQLSAAREIFIGDAIEAVANGERCEHQGGKRPKRGATRFVRREDFERWETLETAAAILASCR